MDSKTKLFAPVLPNGWLSSTDVNKLKHVNDLSMTAKPIGRWFHQ